MRKSLGPGGLASRGISHRPGINEQSCFLVSFFGFFLGKKQSVEFATLRLGWSSSIFCTFAKPDQPKKIRHHATTGFLTHSVLNLLIITHHFIEFTGLTISAHSYRRPHLQGQNRLPATKIGSTLELRPNRNSLVSRRPVLPAHRRLEGRILEAADQILYLGLVLPEVKPTLLVAKLQAEDNIARMRNLSHESNRH